MKTQEFEQFVRNEIAEKREEGYDVAEIEAKFLRSKRKTDYQLKRLLKALEKCPWKDDFPYDEPSDLQEIRAKRLQKPPEIKRTFTDSELYDRIHGGWLGRCAGCLLGKAVEGQTKERIEEWLRIANAYPLNNYFPAIHKLPENPPEWLKMTDVKGASRKKGVLLGQISRMARDDDFDYTIIALHILENYGLNFTTANVGETWLRLLPYWQVFTAERVAYRNLVSDLVPPETATHMNPYREWIGAQIRADVWGYVTPGMPELAAELGYRDAVLSHVKNGIYGEMFVSAMISAAFTTSNVEEIIKIGLSEIPEKSRLAEAARDVLAWSKKCSDWKAAWGKIMEKYGQYHNTHTINNAAMVLLGLLYGDSDFERSITVSVMSGLDTDCNGATAGSIVGVLLGAQDLPEKWIKPLNNQIESFVIGYNNSQISRLAERTCTIARKSLGG